MLEATQYKDNAFVTLTYDDEHLPKDNSLVPKHAQDWLKRFRFAIKPLRIRFFLVGEYGDRFSRPHYHVALFGYPPCYRGRTDHRRNKCCESCNTILETWQLGGIDVGTLTPDSAAYVSGYVTKKLTNKDDEYVQETLDGRHPEFARMSRRPGIGSGFCDEIASTLLTHGLETPEHLPTHLNHGRRQLPLGSYLRDKIRERVGLSKEEVTAYNVQKSKELMQALRDDAYDNASPGFKAFAFKQKVIDAGKGQRDRVEHKSKLYKKRTTL